MPYAEYTNIAIAGIATAVPEKTVTVESLAAHYDAAYLEEFQKKTAIRKKHRVAPHQTGSDLARCAAERALAAAGWEKGSVRGIVVVTQYPDYRMPGNACIMHHQLGLSQDCIAFDVNLGCSGYAYGLNICASMMQQSGMDRMILVCSEVSTPLAPHPTDPDADIDQLLFGDAGTATLLERREDAPPLSIGMWTDGSGYKALYTPFGGARNPGVLRGNKVQMPDGTQIYDDLSYMDGVEVFSFSNTFAVQGVKDFLTHYGLSLESFDGLVLHQANMMIIKQMAKRLKMPMDKVPVSLDRYGNTSSATVPLTICDAYAGTDKQLNLLCTGFGIGLSWSVVNMTLAPDVIHPIVTDGSIMEEGITEYKPVL